jgi:hypothetical protein
MSTNDEPVVETTLEEELKQAKEDMTSEVESPEPDQGQTEEKLESEEQSEENLTTNPPEQHDLEFALTRTCAIY